MDFSVDPPALRSGGRAIEGTAATAEGELRRGQGRTVAATDLAIDAVYQDLTTVTADVVDLVVAALTKSATGTRRMADAYEQADEAAGSRFA